jgi:hypothetical protein
VSDETAQITLWRTLAIGLAGIVLSLVICIYNDQKNFATKDDISSAQGNQQRQLTDIEATLGQHSSSINQLNVDVGRISEHLGITAHPSTVIR